MILNKLIKNIILSFLILLTSSCDLFNNEKNEKALEEQLKKSNGITGIFQLEEKNSSNTRVVIEAFVDSKNEKEKVDALISYNIEENDFDILSVLFDGYEYDFKGNIQGYIKSHNLSKLSLKSVNFFDIFVKGTDEYFEKIINASTQKLTNISVDYTNNDNKTHTLKFSEINFKIKDSVMYFKKDEVIFVYPQYKIIDDSYKMPVFKFKKSDIDEYLIET